MKTAELDPPVTKQIQPAAVPAPQQTAPAPSGGKWWVYLIILLVVAGFGYFIYNRLVAAKQATAASSAKNRAPHDLPVVVATARRGDLDQYLLGLGTVTPLNTVTVKSRVDGAITKINFVEGQQVKTGDALIEIDPRPYQAALKQAQGQLAKDQATKDSADWSVQEDTIALKNNAIAQLQMHTDTAARDQAAGAIVIDQAAIDTANLNLTYAHITSPVDGVIGLRLVDLGNIVHATDTTGLAVITTLQPITVVFTLPEDNLIQLQKRESTGQPLVVEAYDRDLTQKLATGTVLAVDNQIDSTTGTVKIKAIFDNKDNQLFPSQFVNARLLVNTIHNAILVPTAAIQHSPTSTFAYVVVPGPKKDATSQPAQTSQTTQPADAPRGNGRRSRNGMTGTVAVREVTVGPSQAAIGTDGTDMTVVTSGLNPGDVVVTDGVDKLQDGSNVIATPAAPGSTAQHATSRPTTRPATTQRRRRTAD